MFYHLTLYYIISYYIILYHIISYYIILYYIIMSMSCSIILSYIISRLSHSHQIRSYVSSYLADCLKVHMMEFEFQNNIFTYLMETKNIVGSTLPVGQPCHRWATPLTCCLMSLAKIYQEDG